jgi:tRNA splicing ligase
MLFFTSDDGVDQIRIKVAMVWKIFFFSFSSFDEKWNWNWNWKQKCKKYISNVKGRFGAEKVLAAHFITNSFSLNGTHVRMHKNCN